MKKYLIGFLLCAAFIVNGQQNEYTERIRLVEKFSKDHNIKLHAISHAKLAEIMRYAGGFNIGAVDAGKVQTTVGNLDSYIHSLNGYPAQISSLMSIFPYLNLTQAQILKKIIDTHGNDPTPQNFIAALRTKNLGIGFITIAFLEKLIKEAVRPARPNSPTLISLKRIFRRSHKVQRIRLPKASGDYLSNLYASLDYAYTEYKDDTIGTSGQIHDWSMSIHGTIADNTDLSFGFVANESEGNGSVASDFRGQTIGGDFMVHHKLNENYGLGVFGFYQSTDYDQLQTKDYGSGYGGLFSTWHDLGPVQFSTVTSLTKTYYEAGNDTLFNASADITKQWTDKFSTSLKAMYTDSLDTDVSGDNSYWSFGASIGYMLTDKIYTTVGYSTDEALTDYESKTWNVGISWYF